jgi:hypothetical protein
MRRHTRSTTWPTLTTGISGAESDSRNPREISYHGRAFTKLLMAQPGTVVTALAGCMLAGGVLRRPDRRRDDGRRERHGTCEGPWGLRITPFLLISPDSPAARSW